MTTPAEQTAAMIADPAWEFATNPTKAITHASTRAASAATGTGAQWARSSWSERQEQKLFWLNVGLALCAAAGVEPGQVLTNLVNCD